MLMNAKREHQGAAWRAPIKDGVMFLLADVMHDCSPLEITDMEEYITEVILTQYLLKAGLVHFGQRGEEAVTKELSRSLLTQRP